MPPAFQAILITYWQCSSIVAIFTVLGATPAYASNALMLVYNAMLTGQLATLLGITAVSLTQLPFPTAFTVTSTYAASYYTAIPYPILVSYARPFGGLAQEF